jgi:hypothetical protein
MGKKIEISPENSETLEVNLSAEDFTEDGYTIVKIKGELIIVKKARVK